MPLMYVIIIEGEGRRLLSKTSTWLVYYKPKKTLYQEVHIMGFIGWVYQL